MSYRVEYGKPSRNYERNGSHSFLRTGLLACGFSVLLIILTLHFWPEGSQVLERLLSGEDWLTTRQALETMASQLQGGIPLGEAVTAFCREIISAGLGNGQ